MSEFQASNVIHNIFPSMKDNPKTFVFNPFRKRKVCK